MSVSLALATSLLAALVGLIASFVATLLTASTSEEGRARWEPVPYAVGFALLWPALLALAPALFLDGWLKARAPAARAPLKSWMPGPIGMPRACCRGLPSR